MERLEDMIRALGALDWPLLVVLGAFGVVERVTLAMVPPTPAPPPASAPSAAPAAAQRDAAHVAYEAAIADAAVKRPSFAVPLKTIPAAMSMVNVVSFGPPSTVVTTERTFDIWAALPDQLRDACRGAPNPARRIQEILGLPPLDVPDYVVKELVVPRTGLLRPCLGGGDLDKEYCELPMRPPFTMNGGVAAPPTTASRATPAASARPPAPGATDDPAYDDLYFLTAQIWNSYRVGFTATRKSAGDYPFTGYPFTGMGWSYDWSNVPNHIGVSEFVVRRKATVSVASTKTPSEFCAR
jgi:hypothetical protein